MTRIHQATRTPTASKRSGDLSDLEFIMASDGACSSKQKHTSHRSNWCKRKYCCGSKAKDSDDDIDLDIELGTPELFDTDEIDTWPMRLISARLTDTSTTPNQRRVVSASRRTTRLARAGTMLTHNSASTRSVTGKKKGSLSVDRKGSMRRESSVPLSSLVPQGGTLAVTQYTVIEQVGSDDVLHGDLDLMEVDDDESEVESFQTPGSSFGSAQNVAAT